MVPPNNMVQTGAVLFRKGICQPDEALINGKVYGIRLSSSNNDYLDEDSPSPQLSAIYAISLKYETPTYTKYNAETVTRLIIILSITVTKFVLLLPILNLF